MATHVLLTRLAPGALESSEEREEMGRTWLKQVKKRVPGVKFKARMRGCGCGCGWRMADGVSASQFACLRWSKEKDWLFNDLRVGLPQPQGASLAEKAAMTRLE